MTAKEFAQKQKELQRQYEHEKPNGCLTLLSAVVLLGFCWLVYQILFNGF